MAVGQPESAPPPSPRRRYPAPFLIGTITIPVLILDQLSKLFVKAHMTIDETIPLVRHYLDITYVQNPGAAFSIFVDSAPWVRSALLIALSAAAIIVLAILLARAERVSPMTVAYTLILAGAIGNLIDRVARGRVIDFIRAHYYGWNYPVFNVADSAITIGVALIVIASVFGGEADRRG
ncbi:MAG: signal peptidase II [Candidatus Binataceae bacterium]